MGSRRRTPPWTILAALSVAFLGAGPVRVAAQEAGGRKSPALAVALSVALPGGGQIYNGDYLRAGVVIGSTALAAGPVIRTISDIFELDDDRSGTGTHGAAAAWAGLWIWSWVDAHRSARATNRRIEGGRGAVDLGPRVERGPGGRGLGFRLLSVWF